MTAVPNTGSESNSYRAHLPTNLSPMPTISDLFQKGDTLLFKDRKYFDAERTFRMIIQKVQQGPGGESQMRMSPENKRHIIDALNSVGYCIKFRSKDIEATTDEYIPEIDMSCLWEIASRSDRQTLYQ